MSAKFSSTIDVDDISKTIDRIVHSDDIADGEKQRALDTMADTLARLQASARLGKASLLASQNAQTSGAARLSPEAVSFIILALDELSERLAASQVCRLWRTVAQDMPDPWPPLRLHSLGNIEGGSGNLKHAEPVSEHCLYDVDLFARVESNLRQLSGVLALPWTAPVHLAFKLTSHFEDPFEYSKPGARERINDALKGGPPFSRARLADALDVGASSDFIDILRPLCIGANRISSLTLTVLCGNWLLLLPCLPPMTALRTLIIVAHEETEDNFDEDNEKPVTLPHSLCEMLGKKASSGPPLHVAFPVLETLEVKGISFTDSYDSELSIPAGRIAAFLASMPLLRRLKVESPTWPSIISDSEPLENDSDDEPNASSEKDKTDKKNAQGGKVDLKHLKKIVLRSTGEWGGKNNRRSIARLMDILPVNPGASVKADTEDVSKADTDSDVSGDESD